MKNPKSQDFYHISAPIVRSIKNLIVVHLTMVINKCINHEYFLNMLKISEVIPVYKKRDYQKDVPNYWPIPLVSVFSKIVESLLEKQIKAFAERHGLFISLV